MQAVAASGQGLGEEQVQGAPLHGKAVGVLSGSPPQEVQGLAGAQELGGQRAADKGRPQLLLDRVPLPPQRAPDACARSKPLTLNGKMEVLLPTMINSGKQALSAA